MAQFFGFFVVFVLIIGAITGAVDFIKGNWEVLTAIALAITTVITIYKIISNRIDAEKHKREMEERKQRDIESWEAHKRQMEAEESERKRRNVERFDSMVLSCPKCGALARAVPRTAAIYACTQCGFRLQGPTHDVDEIPQREGG